MSGEDVIEQVGLPAILEGLAEESAELTQMCLKLSRKLRDENPTPLSASALLEKLREETADVLVYIDVLLEADIVNEVNVSSAKDWKRNRWETRLKEKMQNL